MQDVVTDRTNTTEFEGVITYKITYINNRDSSGNSDTMRLYYSKGNLVKQYNSTSSSVLKKELFIGSTNSYYMKFGNSDSLYAYDISKNDRVLVNTNATDNDATILGHDCNRIEFNQLHTGEYNFYIYSSFWYSDKILKVNPEYFKGWNYGGFNKFINKTGVLYLKFQSAIQYYGKTELSTKIFQAVGIEEKKLDPKIFAIDSSVITRYRQL